MDVEKKSAVFRVLALALALALAGFGGFAHARDTQDGSIAPVAGPMQICFKYSSFTLLEGERVVGFQGGVEAMSIDLVGPTGAFRIGESEIFAAPGFRGRRVARHDHTSVYRLRDPSLSYAVYGKTDFSYGRDRLVIWLSGEALDGSRRDAQIYDRLVVGDTTGLRCQQTFTYSWDLVLGMTPIEPMRSATGGRSVLESR